MSFGNAGGTPEGMVPYFPYKQRIRDFKDRYVQAYQLGLETINDYLGGGPDSDYYTPSRQALRDVCSELSGIEYWHFCDCGSDAIQAALSVFTKPFDKVIMPAWGFMAVPQSVRYLTRSIVFVDNGTDALMCPKSLANAVDQHPDAKVVMPVHIVGITQDVEQIAQVVPDSMRIVEDAANAFHMGDEPWKQNKPGEFSDAVVYSFDMAKSPAGTGTGGGIATNSHRTIDRLKTVTQQGWKKFRNGTVVPGTKSSMDDTTCRVVAEDIKICQELNIRKRRRENFELFSKEIKREQLTIDNSIMGFPFFPKKMSALEANKVFKENNIKCSVYPCFPNQDQYKDQRSVGHEYAERLSKELIITPMHQYLTNMDKETIISIANSV